MSHNLSNSLHYIRFPTGIPQLWYHKKMINFIEMKCLTYEFKTTYILLQWIEKKQRMNICNTKLDENILTIISLLLLDPQSIYSYHPNTLRRYTIIDARTNASLFCYKKQFTQGVTSKYFIEMVTLQQYISLNASLFILCISYFSFISIPYIVVSPWWNLLPHPYLIVFYNNLPPFYIISILFCYIDGNFFLPKVDQSSDMTSWWGTIHPQMPSKK